LSLHAVIDLVGQAFLNLPEKVGVTANLSINLFNYFAAVRKARVSATIEDLEGNVLLKAVFVVVPRELQCRLGSQGGPGGIGSGP